MAAPMAFAEVAKLNEEMRPTGKMGIRQHNEHETWANSSVGQRTISFDWNALCITVEEIVLTINWKRVGKEAERRENDH